MSKFKRIFSSIFFHNKKSTNKIFNIILTAGRIQEEVMQVNNMLNGIGQLPMSGYFFYSLKIFYTGHRVWYWQRRFEKVTESQETMGQYGMGIMVSVAIEGTIFQKPIEELAHVADFGRTMIQSISDMYSLVNSYREFVDEICQKHVYHVKVNIGEGRNFVVIIVKAYDPTFAIWASTYLHLLVIRIEKLVIHTIALFWAAFVLSSSLTELVKKHSGTDGFTKMDQKNSLFLNVNSIMGELKKNREFLVQEFKTNQQMIDHFLRVIGNETTVKSLKSYALQSISYYEKGLRWGSPIKTLTEVAMQGVRFLTGKTTESPSTVVISKNSTQKKEQRIVFQGPPLSV